MLMIDLLIEAYSFMIGLPLQRLRAKRLLKTGRGQVVVAYPEPTSALLVRRMAGVAEFAPGSIQLRSWRTNVIAVEVPGKTGSVIDRQDSRIVFGPKQIVYRVHAQRGSFDLSLLAITAETLIERLKVEMRETRNKP